MLEAGGVHWASPADGLSVTHSSFCPSTARPFGESGRPSATTSLRIRPALDASLVTAILACRGWKLVFPAGWPLYLRFGIEVVAGATAYLIVLLVLHIDRLRGFIDF